MAGSKSSLIFEIFGKDKTASKALKGVGDQAGKTSKKLGGIGVGTVAAGTALGSLAAGGIAAAGLGLAGIISKQGEFERSMNQVAVAANVPQSELKAMSDLALKMGADTQYSAGEAAAAMLELAKGGFTPAQISAGALKSTMGLAAAGQLDLAEAASVTSAAMNTFNISAEDSAVIADALAGGANASSADVADLGMSLKQVGQQASASGQSLQQTVGALAAFADAGVKGQDAGTSLKVFLQRLVPTTDKAKAAFENFGIEAFDATGKMKPLTAIADELKNGLSGLTQEQRLAALQTMFGSDALRAANVLYTQGSAGIAKYVDATSEQGNAQKMADASMKGTAGSIEQMMGSLETLGIQLGTFIAPAVVALTGAITVATNWLGQHLGPAVEKMSPLFAALGTWISGTMIPAVKDLAASFMENVWPAIKMVAGIIAENLQPVIEALQKFWAETLQPAVAKIIPILGTVAKVIGIVVGALAVVISWIVGKVAPVFYGVLGPVINFTLDILGKVAEAIEWVIDNFGNMVDFVKGLPGKFKSGLSTLLKILTAPFRLSFNAIAALWNNTVGKLSFTIPDWVPGVGGQGWDVPDIPMLAKGGIVTRPTLALIGEAGPEAVVPLSRGGGYGGTTVHVHLDGVVIGRNAGAEIVEQIEAALRGGTARPRRLAVR